MKALEGHTIEQVKEMSYEELAVLAEKVGREMQEELAVLAEKVGREMQAEDIREKIIGVIDVMDAQNTLIES